MDKDKNKGLADNQDGEFILNESGTSVTIDVDPDIDSPLQENKVDVKEPGDSGAGEKNDLKDKE